MATPKLTLYDLSPAENKPFSLNTWQIRLALNFKCLPFKTVWLNYIDIAPTMKRIGASPTYFPPVDKWIPSVPVLVDSSNPDSPATITGCSSISEYLDSKYPEPSLFPPDTNALMTLYDEHLQEKLLPVIWPLVVPLIPAILAERDIPYYRQTREAWLGMKLEEVCPVGPKRDEAWENARKEFDVLDKLLLKNGDGEGKVWVMGDHVSRGDFVLLAMLLCVDSVLPEGREKIMTWNNGRWLKMWVQSEPWRLNKV